MHAEILIIIYWYHHEWSSTPHRRNVCLRRKCCIRSRYDLDLWPVTLKTFSTVTACMMIICGKFYWNTSTNYRDITSRETRVYGQLLMDNGRTEKK